MTAADSMRAATRRNGHAHGFSAAYLARITPRVAPVREVSSGRLAAFWRRLVGSWAGRRAAEVPDALREDVGLDTGVRGHQAEFNRLDAQLHARFY